MRPLRAIVTAGGTREPIDDVRVVANTSTGRFGVAIARALAWRGVDVTLVEAEQIDASGLPRQVRRLRYRTTSDLVTVLGGVLDGGLAAPPDALLMAAAVSDYTPIATAGKLRSDADRLVIELDRTPKILPTLRDRCPDALLVGSS
jgi:phosphopantothenoylcysteine decarboxylase/phosphopantothenate--cysteine ligase